MIVVNIIMIMKRRIRMVMMGDNDDEHCHRYYDES